MKSFEVLIAESFLKKNDGLFVKEERLTLQIPEEAMNLLAPILEPYGQSPYFYFDKIVFNNRTVPVPWAFVCLDSEHSIAGHIATKRPPEAGIQFTQYQPMPVPIPPDFVPNVGTLVFGDKRGLELASCQSLIFEKAWEVLKNCSPEKNWLVILDPLPEEWLTEHLSGDRELYLSTKK